MKTFKYLTLLLLGAATFAACSDDDGERGSGAPVIAVQDVAPAMFGDSITFHVNCKDAQGVPLSTLKAALFYGEEEVQNVTLRTKTDGDYTFKMYAPYFKDVPNGTANLTLTLQNIHFTKTETAVPIELKRPEYPALTLVTSSGREYKMLPDATNPYLFKALVASPDSKTVQGYIKVPTAKDAHQLTFGQGTEGVTQDETNPISFVNTARGTFEVTFNVLTYEYTPVYSPETAAQELVFSEADKEFNGELVQGRKYEFVGLDAFADPAWSYDSDFFERDSQGSFTFKAATGNYHITANTTRKGLQIWALKPGSTDPQTLSSDGSGAIWLIGNDGIAKPSFSYISGQGWWTDTDHALCLAPIGNKVYRISLTVGKELRANDINFKFFGQQGWGLEFKGESADAWLQTNNPYFIVGDGTNNHDSGNIYLADGVTLNDGETYVFTIDCSAGIAPATLSVTKQ